MDSPRKSSRGSCPATAMGSSTVRALVPFLLSLLSHTRGGTPGLARSWRWGLVAMSRIGLLKSTDMPKTRDAISLLTASDSGMGFSNMSTRTSRTFSRCLAKARSAKVGAQSAMKLKERACHEVRHLLQS